MYKGGDVGKGVTAQNSNANVDYTPCTHNFLSDN